jgi:DNA-binding transcriptional ArsR family regulator
MQSPYSNPYLSLRARGLYAFYIETGRVLSADEISTAVPEGRDAIRAAMKELKDAGYIKAVKAQVGGQWRTTLKFTDDGLSGVGNPGALYSLLNTNDITTSLNVLEVLRTSNTSAALKPKEGIEMGWPNLDENLPKKRSDIDEAPGAVGKIEDKKAMRNAKYKKTKFEAVPASMRRYERPEETWTSKDLVSEFYDLVREKASGIPGQINGEQLAKWINKTISESDATNLSILKAIRVFFADPRLLNDAGIGQPIWRRFIAFYPTIHGITSRVAETDFVDEDALANQERLLKLLEGK